MGRRWDYFVPSAFTWQQLERTLAPGAHAIMFGGPKTFHRMAVNIEDGGFEMRDLMQWLFGQGYPKNKSLLKPGYEPIVLARKYSAKFAPLNIDPCRANGRYPSNVIFDEEAAALLDAEVGDLGQTSKPGTVVRKKEHTGVNYLRGSKPTGEAEVAYGDSGGPSRFYYTAKADRAQRDAGLGDFEAKSPLHGKKGSGGGLSISNAKNAIKNDHPTVKPIDLIRYLATLILPPKRDTPRRILVPYSGSGSEMIGCLQAGWDEVVGIERDEKYIAFARARISKGGVLSRLVKEKRKRS